MSSQQYSRALLTTLAALRSATRHQIRRQSHTCAHSRSLSLAAAARQQLAHVESPRPGSGVTAASTGTTSLHLEFCDGRRSTVPYSWLRDNCQCHKCNGNYSSLRNPTSPFQVTVHPEIIQSNVFGVVLRGLAFQAVVRWPQEASPHHCCSTTSRTPLTQLVHPIINKPKPLYSCLEASYT
ncbi:hypothetical protein Pmani_023019 [Petrolisthes manimaculis]|uniref:Gamma-butyrobetaine hydroxylase-like N-terminal domain-containing protein n=1 Tax=Petrolisthes manimaculis TaxID=1843537 RepID=A0AAE1U3R1_9EUCA|nr:hypothetical protein Pmani_023019 [Petrolisthes manimaculis]